MRKFLAITLSLVMHACSESGSTSSSQMRGDASARAGLQAAGSLEQATLQERQAQLAAETLELEKLGLINAALCEQLSKMRKQCLAKKPLLSNAVVTQLACSGELERVPLQSKVEVSVSSEASGTFTLKVNNSYTSAALAPGQTTELVFTPLVDTASSAPTFENITSLELIPGTLSLPSGEKSATVALDFFIDGQKFFKTSVAVSAKGLFPLNIEGIHQNLLSAACRMSQDGMSALLSPFQDKSPSKTSSGEKPNDEPYDARKLAKLEAQLAALHPALEGARNRSFKLKNELLGGSGSGCHLQEKIENLTITVSGSKVRERVSNNNKSKKKSSGDASTLDINLGGVSYASENFIGALIPEKDLTSVSIGSLDRIVLTKQGVQFDNLSTPCKGGVIGFINDKTNGNICYDIDEEEVMMIDSLKIEANGLVLYQKGSLNIKLNNQKLHWETYDLQTSPEWSQMLQRTDCNSNL